MINENQVNIVSEFKLLDIIIDDKLNFNAFASKIRKAINIRLYSIQKLFQLPISVKIQFLKTFILHYFDYCTALCIYFSNTILQKLTNTYNSCIYKLLNIPEIRTTNINTTHDFNK
jgi:hypothetical protein